MVLWIPSGGNFVSSGLNSAMNSVNLGNAGLILILHGGNMGLIVFDSHLGRRRRL